MTNAPQSAVVLLSGGLDSATVLAVALGEGFACHCLSFDYGQKNRHELAAAARVAAAPAGGRRADSHRVVRIFLDAFGGSAMTESGIAVPKNAVPENGEANAIPVTYVPARNTIFLSYGLALAEVVEADAVFIGVNSVDYSGYPDCRPEFIAAYQAMANLATKRGVEGNPVAVRAPLQTLSKSAIIQLGTRLGVDYGQTLTCYDPVGAEGLACGECDACRLRRQGFAEAGVADPTRYAGQ